MSGYTVNVALEIQSGVPYSAEIAEEIKGLIEIAAQGFDLSRLERVILAVDYEAALNGLDYGYQRSREAKPTREDYAQGVAMAQMVMREGEPWTILVIDARIALGLLDEDEESRSMVTGLIIHELAHVHDQRKKSIALPNIWLKPHLDLLHAVLFEGADSAWSEYFACRMTATVDPHQLTAQLETLENALERVQQTLRAEIIDYRTSADLERVWSIGQQQVTWLIQVAGYALGTLDGLKVNLADEAPELAEKLERGYFLRPWHDLQTALRQMWDVYPEWPEGLDTYKPAMDAVEQSFHSLGFRPSLKNEGLYIDIPYTSDTLPPNDPFAVLFRGEANDA